MSFDCEIQSLIFPGNKATDQNEYDDDCEEYEQLNQIGAEKSLGTYHFFCVWGGSEF